MPRLFVEGPYEFTDLRVLDDALHTVATGTGQLDVDLAPGIYRVQAYVPGAVDERLVAVGVKEPATSVSFDLPLDSSAPLPGLRTGHESHIEPAIVESRHPHVSVSDTGESVDARLFIFLRSDGAPRTEPPLLTLETQEREVLARLDQHGHVDLGHGFAALTVDLPAGTYTLAFEAPGLGLRGQAVFVETGWETQVFVPWDAGGADPGRALAYMVPRGRGFQPRAGDYTHVEAALDGLARGRIVLTRTENRTFLNAKFDNPMLGLIGTYSYLLDQPIELDRLGIITYNLHSLLPHSPDAQVLRRLYLRRSGRDAFSDQSWSIGPGQAPPMFATGTDLLLDMAAEDSTLVAPREWVTRVAATRTSGSVWTRWNLGMDANEQIRSAVEAYAGRRISPVEVARKTGLPLSVVEERLKAPTRSADLPRVVSRRAVDTFTAFVGIYDNVSDADADYDLVKELHTKAALIDAYDAAVVEHRADGKVKITKKHETPTRVGGVVGGGVGLATGLVVALFPFAAIGGGLLAATTGGGAVLGALAGHAVAGMSRKDLKELGEHLDAGQAGLVVVALSDMGGKVEREMKRARKIEARELKVDRADIEADARSALANLD